MSEPETSARDRMEIAVGDITSMDVDAIVNAANSQLAPGGGVCGAIHRAAGPDLAREAGAKAPCPTGEARITKGYNLPARYVIHTVGPVWHGGRQGEAGLLASAYRNSLELAREHDLDGVAFPGISTGIFGYPKDAAAHLAVNTVARYLEEHDRPRRVIFACFSEEDEKIYRQELARLS